MLQHLNGYCWEESSFFWARIQESSVGRDQTLKVLKKQRNFDNYLQLFATQIGISFPLKILCELLDVIIREKLPIERRLVSFEQTLKRVV